MYSRIIQSIGVIAVVAAIELEIWLHEPVFMILATAGSLVFAVGTKLVYFSKKKKQDGK